MNAAQTIIVGVDGSAGSALALRWAAATAGALGARVIAVHAFEPPMLAVGLRISSVPPEVLSGAVNEARLAAQEHLEGEWSAPLREAGVPFETESREGHPAESLLDAAEEHDADLIVLGRRGHSELHHLLLGSISHHVVNHATVPVVIIPPAS